MATATATVLNSSGVGFLITNTVLDSDGNSFVVDNYALDSDGNSFLIFVSQIINLNTGGGADRSDETIKNEDIIIMAIIKKYMRVIV